MSTKRFHIYFANLVHPNFINCLHRRFSLAQMPFSNGQAVCSIQCIILLKRPVEIHQVMQPDRLIRLIVHQQTPVFPMAVGVAHQIIQNVHHIVSVGIQFQNFIQRVPIMICAVDIVGCISHKAISLRGHNFADGNQLILKHPLLIQNLMTVKASTDLTCQHLTLNCILSTIFIKIEAIILAHPRFRIASASGQIICQKMGICHSHLMPTQCIIHKSIA